MPWTISRQVEPHTRPGVEADGWIWEIERDGETRRLMVEIMRTALVGDEQALPITTAAAIKTEGRSEVEAVLDQVTPPRVIVCGLEGCRARPQTNVRLGH